MTKATREQLEDMATDMFISETRRGWLPNGCSWIGADPNSTREQYIERFVEQYRDRDVDDLLQMGDDARPSNSVTAHEREIAENMTESEWAAYRAAVGMGPSVAAESRAIEDRIAALPPDWLDRLKRP